MECFSPMNVLSISKNKYVPVMVCEYSRFTWVFFLENKDEEADEIIKFIKKMKIMNDTLLAPIHVVRSIVKERIEFQNHFAMTIQRPLT